MLKGFRNHKQRSVLILCTTLRPFVRLELTCISTSGNHTSSHTLIPIFFPLGSILLKFLNLRLRFYSTPTKLLFQLKILAKDFIKEFPTSIFGSWYKLLFISFVVVKRQEEPKSKSYILDFHNFAVDVQPQIHGAITQLKHISDNIVSLISPMNFGKYFCETAIVELNKNLYGYEKTSKSQNSIRFIEYRNSFILNLDSCFTKDFVEVQSTRFGIEYAEMPIKGIAQINSRKFMMTPKLELAIKKDSAVFLGYCHNQKNYYHFLIEQFPRLLRWLEHESLSQIPILCDEDAPWQIQTLIEQTSGIKPLLIRKDRLHLFQTLIVAEDFRHTKLPDVMDLTLANTFDSHRTDLLSTRDFLLSHYAKKCDSKNYDYLFLGRPVNGTRRPNNQDFVEKILVNQYGFYSPDLLKLGIQEQIDLFSAAKVIVGISGAALTNLMFCKPNSLIVLQSDTFNSNSRFWPDFASLFDLQIEDITKRVNIDVDSPYDINIEELLEILRKFRM